MSRHPQVISSSVTGYVQSAIDLVYLESILTPKAIIVPCLIVTLSRVLEKDTPAWRQGRLESERE